MPNLNRVMLMGNLTRDPELRYTPSNTAVAQIGLAINHRWKDQSGEQREEVTFIDCEAWGRTAEVLNQYLRKGRPVYVEGRLKLDQWQDKEGNSRSKLKVVVETFQFIDSKGGDGEGGGGGGGGGNYNRSPSQGQQRPPQQQRPAQSSPQQQQPPSEPYQPVDEDNIPF